MINFDRAEQAAIVAKREVMWNELHKHYTQKATWQLYKDSRHGSLKWSINQRDKAPNNLFWRAWVNYLQSEEMETIEKPSILKEVDEILYNQQPNPEPLKRKPRKPKPFKSMGTIQREAIDAGTGSLFRQMPDWILRAPRPAEYKIIYALLLSYQGVNDNAWPGYELLCEQAQVSRATLSKTIKNLTNDGLIKVKRRGLGMSNRYEVFDQFKGKPKSSSNE